MANAVTRNTSSTLRVISKIVKINRMMLIRDEGSVCRTGDENEALRQDSVLGCE